MRIQKKPVYMDAVQVKQVLRKDLLDELPEWVQGAMDKGIIQLAKGFYGLEIKLGEGVSIEANQDDWVVKDQFGFISPFEDDRFWMAFEEVKEN